jgi:hypothetical protein
MSANDVQIGGRHYKRPGVIEHWDMVEQYGLGYLEGCATKYLQRYKDKNGVQDLEKARHYATKLIELTEVVQTRWFVTYPNAPSTNFRLPRGRVPDGVVGSFCRGMENAQYRAIKLLCQWRTVAELELVVSIIDGMIWAYDTPQDSTWGNECHRPGTPEDGGHHARQPDEEDPSPLPGWLDWASAQWTVTRRWWKS